MTHPTTFLVNEVYPCLQGEGTNLGVPSVLVRLQVCNLRCTWCDTPYTHTLKSDPVNHNEPTGPQKFTRLSQKQLLAKITELSGTRLRNVILSGGEPTLQPIHRLYKELLPTFGVEIESNGTQIPHEKWKDFEPQDYLPVLWNISPKGANAGETWDEKALKHWAQQSVHGNVLFKFVIRKTFQTIDLNEIIRFKEQFSVSHQQILLMAEGTSIESQTEQTWLETICLEHGFRYSPRLHVMMHGSKRGV